MSEVEVEEVSGSRFVRFVGELDISTEGPASAQVTGSSLIALLDRRLEFVDDAREIAAGNEGS